MLEYIRIHPSDTVAVAVAALSPGTNVVMNGINIVIRDNIPAGHKFAITDHFSGDDIIKYGYPIGHATVPIYSGCHVHTHNMATNLSGQLTYQWNPVHSITPVQPNMSFFQGYRRMIGNPGIRNELWILPTVGCVNDIARALERDANRFLSPKIDHIYAFPHPYGCSQLGDDQDNTRQILADLATHPNVGGVLILGLGCENSGVDSIINFMGSYDPSRVRSLVCQRVGDEYQEGMKLLSELAERMNKDQRVSCPASALTVGLKCGGSDGFSGITANPVIGLFSDSLIASGGSTILTEVPEMFGAETILMNRCESRKVFDSTVNLINEFKQYYESAGLPVYENPSPGNKSGGISTLEDKSLGCTQKSGTSPVSGVMKYGEKVKGSGLYLLSAPGNDLVASTALAASGAQLILFSTGRGTPFACPVPTVKISSNSALASHKQNWIDFSAADLLVGKAAKALAEELYALVLNVASGQFVKSEINGFHDFAIFKQGVTL